MNAPIAENDLLEKIADAVKAAGGAITRRENHVLNGTLTAIKAKWFLGGRKVTDSVTCRLIPEAHEVRLRETAVDTSWGLPPPTFTAQTTTQYGTRVNQSRVDKGVAGGGVLEFGKFRESVEQAVNDAGWQFVLEVV